jgi:hypothetical protein
LQFILQNELTLKVALQILEHLELPRLQSFRTLDFYSFGCTTQAKKIKMSNFGVSQVFRLFLTPSKELHFRTAAGEWLPDKLARLKARGVVAASIILRQADHLDPGQ